MWNFAATAATPYAEAVEKALLTAANGRVRFRPGKSGTIYLSCPIVDSEPVKSYNNLTLTFQGANPAGTATDARVAATLKRISKTSGNISNVAGISSDSYPGTAPTTIVNATSAPFSLSVWDKFADYYYYIIITLWRTPTSMQNPVAFGVGLKL